MTRRADGYDDSPRQVGGCVDGSSRYRRAAIGHRRAGEDWVVETGLGTGGSLISINPIVSGYGGLVVVAE